MKSLGLVRAMDKLGRVVIPKELRDTKGWEIGQRFEMFVEGDKFILRPFIPSNEQDEKKEILMSLARLLESNNETIQEIALNTIKFIEKENAK